MANFTANSNDIFDFGGSTFKLGDNGLEFFDYEIEKYAPMTDADYSRFGLNKELVNSKAFANKLKSFEFNGDDLSEEITFQMDNSAVNGSEQMPKSQVAATNFDNINTNQPTDAMNSVNKLANQADANISPLNAAKISKLESEAASNLASAELNKGKLDKLNEGASFGEIAQTTATLGNLGLGIASYFDNQKLRDEQIAGIKQNIASAKAANKRKSDFLSASKSAFA